MARLELLAGRKKELMVIREKENAAYAARRAEAAA